MSFSADKVVFFSYTPQPTYNRSFAGSSLYSDRSDCVPLAEDYPHFSAKVNMQNGTWDVRQNLAPSS